MTSYIKEINQLLKECEIKDLSSEAKVEKLIKIIIVHQKMIECTQGQFKKHAHSEFYPYKIRKESFNDWN